MLLISFTTSTLAVGWIFTSLSSETAEQREERRQTNRLRTAQSRLSETAEHCDVNEFYSVCKVEAK